LNVFSEFPESGRTCHMFVFHSDGPYSNRLQMLEIHVRRSAMDVWQSDNDGVWGKLVEITAERGQGPATRSAVRRAHRLYR
jgi:hypothetical protein